MSASTARVRRNENLLAQVAVDGVRGVSARTSAVVRACASDRCGSAPIVPGDAFVRVLPADGPSEDFHRECFEWEYVT